MCDSQFSRSGGDNSTKCIEGPPQSLPSWFKCPPPSRERNYPVPEGVNILPISQGGRNGPTKKQFKCGQCGQDARPKKDTKPNVPADCPMVKARCPGLADEGSDKKDGEGKGSVVDRIKNFFGGKDKADLRLVEACKALLVEDEQIRHHRDVFSTQLFWSKGYFSPFSFFTKVDCQGKPEGDCTCGKEKVVEEEPECVEEEEEEEPECIEEEEEEPECVEEEVVNEDECVEEESDEVEQEEYCDEDAGGEYEEECVEDAEGECILEESAECMDDDCKLYFDKPSSERTDTSLDKPSLECTDTSFDKPSSECTDTSFGKAPSESTDTGFDKSCNCMTNVEGNNKTCQSMNNFIIRVSSPFNGASTNETCEQIIERLTKRSTIFPDPGPKKEKQEEDCMPQEEIEIVVKQISVQKPTCECPPKCNDPLPPPKNDCQKPPPPKNDSEKPPPPVENRANPSTSPIETCAKQPPPPVDNCEKPPPPPDECPRPRRRDPPSNDCATLTEEELLHMPIKKITCGCPKLFTSKCTSDAPGASYAGENSVWIPPAPPPCAMCGSAQRGANEDCYPCQLTRRMRSGIPEINGSNYGSTDVNSLAVDIPPFNRCDDKTKKKDDNQDESCTPEYLPDGSIKYKGGISNHHHHKPE